MAATRLIITKEWADGTDLTEAQLDNIKTDTEAWALDTVQNLEQLTLDVFGSSYTLDNDGVANNTTAMNVGQTITPTATGIALDVAGGATTTGKGLDMTDFDAITTGTIIDVASNSSSTGSRSLVNIVNSNSSASGTVCLFVQQEGDEQAMTIDQNNTGTPDALVIFDAGTGRSIDIDKDGNSGSDIYGIRIVCDNAGAGLGGGIDLSGFSVVEPAINFVDGTASSIDPSATAETGWINIAVGGTIRYIPYYAAS